MLVAYRRQLDAISGTLCVWEDAARLGDPAKETVVYLAWAATRRVDVAMAPQVAPQRNTINLQAGGHSNPLPL